MQDICNCTGEREIDHRSLAWTDWFKVMGHPYNGENCLFPKGQYFIPISFAASL